METQHNIYVYIYIYIYHNIYILKVQTDKIGSIKKNSYSTSLGTLKQVKA